MKIPITGTVGFIGLQFVLPLLDREDEVVSVDQPSDYYIHSRAPKVVGI